MPVARSCTLEWMYSSGKRLMLFAQSIFSTLRSSQHSISSVTVYTRLCMMMYVSRSVCTYDSTYLDEMQCMCAYDDTSRLGFMRGSRLVSSSHNSIWDDEWWWVSRLDFLMRSRLVLIRCVSISTRKNYQVSTRFYVRISKNLCPLGWQIARSMLRSLSPQHLDTFYKDWVQIV